MKLYFSDIERQRLKAIDLMEIRHKRDLEIELKKWQKRDLEIELKKWQKRKWKNKC